MRLPFDARRHFVLVWRLAPATRGSGTEGSLQPEGPAADLSSAVGFRDPAPALSECEMETAVAECIATESGDQQATLLVLL